MKIFAYSLHIIGTTLKLNVDILLPLIKKVIFEKKNKYKMIPADSFVHYTSLLLVLNVFERKIRLILKIVYDVNAKNAFYNIVPVHGGRVCTKRMNVIRCVQPIHVYLRDLRIGLKINHKMCSHDTARMPARFG